MECGREMLAQAPSTEMREILRELSQIEPTTSEVAIMNCIAKCSKLHYVARLAALNASSAVLMQHMWKLLVVVVPTAHHALEHTCEIKVFWTNWCAGAG